MTTKSQKKTDGNGQLIKKKDIQLLQHSYAAVVKILMTKLQMLLKKTRTVRSSTQQLLNTQMKLVRNLQLQLQRVQKCPYLT